MSAMAPSSTILFISRILQGIAAAMIFANVYSLIASVFPKEEKGRALSLVWAQHTLDFQLAPF